MLKICHRYNFKSKVYNTDKDKNLKNKRLVENLAIEVVDVDGLGRFCIGSNINNLNEKRKYYIKKNSDFSKNISSRLQLFWSRYSNYRIKGVKIMF